MFLEGLLSEVGMVALLNMVIIILFTTVDFSIILSRYLDDFWVSMKAWTNTAIVRNVSTVNLMVIWCHAFTSVSSPWKISEGIVTPQK